MKAIDIKVVQEMVSSFVKLVDYDIWKDLYLIGDEDADEIVKELTEAMKERLINMGVVILEHV